MCVYFGICCLDGSDTDGRCTTYRTKIYYAVVIFAYLVFEMIPINYRPVLIDGGMEVSYPSSTTLLVLCVMPTLVEQAARIGGGVICIENGNIKMGVWERISEY